MIFNSRVLAFSLALVISMATTAVLGFFELPGILLPITVFIITFFTTYICILLLLELLVYREIKRIRNLIEKLNNKDFSILELKYSSRNNPLGDIDKQIYTYATGKQKEIDELKKIEQFRKEFIANVSHELKTPIFAAQGFVHTLLDGAIKDKSVRKKFLKKAAKSLDGLDILVQDLLILSQIETGEIRMNFEYFELRKLIDDIIDQFDHKAERKNITLRTSYPLPLDENELTVYADWQRIQQVLNNLISNAINYTNEEGEVTISVTREKDRLLVSVSDTGIGIPPEDLSRIFERFYRVDKSRSRARGGTGLGLAIVKHILEGHRTSIQVRSIPGEGSVFSFSLPTDEPVTVVQE